MNAPPFPANPSFGQYFGNWVWSGSRWVCTNTNGVRIVVQVFRASAPYTPSPGLISATVETVGAGGQGGAVSGAASTVAGGGGGGSGGYSRITLAAGLVLGGVNVTIGSCNVNPPVSNPFDYALYGGPTSFGSMCVANGGGGGGGNAASLEIWGFPGLGAPVGVGDIALPGNPGGIGTSQAGSATAINTIGATGGAIWGGGGMAQLCGQTLFYQGNPGMGPGAGGGGAAMNMVQTPTPQAGGIGADGICVVTEYCWADTVDDGCGCGPTPGQARVAIGGHGWSGFDND